MRVSAGTKDLRLVILNKTGVETVQAVTVTTTWQRFSVTSNVGSGGSTPTFIVRNNAGATAGTVLVTFLQAEGVNATSTTPAVWPSSYIATAGAGVARNPDIIRIPQARIPVGLWTKGFRISFSPYYSSAQQITYNFNSAILGNPDTLGVLQLALSAGTVRVASLTSHVAACPQVTWAANALLTVTMEPSEGRITLEGFATGNGVYTIAPWVLAPADLYVGENSSSSPTSSSGPFAGRIGRELQVLAA
jgi:hypothetical protein